MGRSIQVHWPDLWVINTRITAPPSQHYGAQSCSCWDRVCTVAQPNLSQAKGSSCTSRKTCPGEVFPAIGLLQFLSFGNIRLSFVPSTITRSLLSSGAWGSWDDPAPLHHPGHVFSGMFVSQNIIICCLLQGCRCLCWKKLSTQSLEDLGKENPQEADREKTSLAHLRF